MKCVVCNGVDISLKLVDEEVRTGADIVLVAMNILMCNQCGERYYDQLTMQKIEKLKDKMKTRRLKMEEVGKVYRAKAA